MNETPLAGLPEVTDAEKFADAAVATWHDVYAALSPIIGPGGVAALYRRSLSLRLADYPWLANVSECPLPPGDFSALRRELSQQAKADPVAANGALLRSFSQLLTNLIGASLTARLLQSVWEKHGHTAQDTSP
jgi:hypothetical protein